MQGFVKVAEGVDVLPLRMAVERQDAVFQGKSAVALFAEGEWLGEFYAFPQLRGLLLDIMRRVECGELKNISIVKMGEVEAIGPLGDAACSMVTLMLGDGAVQGAGALRAGDILWASGAFPLIFQAPTGAAVVVIFAPIP